MADLVRDHVRLREIAGRAEAVLQFLEERGVEIELAVGRDSRTGPAAELALPHIDTTDLRNRTSLGGS